VESIARSYVWAGSRILLTNTFGANRIAFERRGIDAEAEEVTRAGVEISLRSAGESARVFASIGPTGGSLRHREVSAAEARDAFKRQVQIIAESGAHGIVVETMVDLDEALLALNAARETGLPVVVSMVFGLPGSTRPQVACEILAGEGASVIGVNCMSGRDCITACRQMREATRLPIWAKPNAGLPQWTESGWVYPLQPPAFAELVVSLADFGADYIGGCCGTTETHIRAAAEALARRASR
jgi:methionine synthase I (cobalamin-dependent)